MCSIFYQLSKLLRKVNVTPCIKPVLKTVLHYESLNWHVSTWCIFCSLFLILLSFLRSRYGPVWALPPCQSVHMIKSSHVRGWRLAHPFFFFSTGSFDTMYQPSWLPALSVIFLHIDYCGRHRCSVCSLESSVWYYLDLTGARSTPHQ